MAPETRIGLVVGLAFIVCFAIILANKGVRSDGQLKPVSVAELRGEVHPTGRAVTVPSFVSPERVPRSPSMRHASRRPASKRPVPIRSMQSTDSLPAPSTGAILLTGDSPDGLSSTPAALPPRGAIERAVLTGGQRAAARGNGLPDVRGVSNHSADQVAFTPPVAETDRDREVANRVGAARGSTALHRKAHRADGVIRHKIVKGDTLSKTVAHYYGKRSAAIVRAIFEANRSVLNDPNLLPVGTVLTLPVVNGVAPRRGRDRTGASNSAVPDHRRSPTHRSLTQPFRWYQIRKKDRYASIAREQLGDESRWREIYELNRDKFPDADRIREGVRIKLPGTKVAAAGAG